MQPLSAGSTSDKLEIEQFASSLRVKLGPKQRNVSLNRCASPPPCHGDESLSLIAKAISWQFTSKESEEADSMTQTITKKVVIELIEQKKNSSTTARLLAESILFC